MLVIAGLVPAIYVFSALRLWQGVDARDKPGPDVKGQFNIIIL